jgi:Mn-dependent DtxR family transcriptional regulator
METKTLTPKELVLDYITKICNAKQKCITSNKGIASLLSITPEQVQAAILQLHKEQIINKTTEARYEKGRFFGTKRIITI